MIFNITSGKKWIYDQVTVTITGHTSTGTYNGSAQSVSGYDVSINYPGYTTSDFTFSGTASASGTNVGTYNMGLASAQFTNTNPMYRNVVFVITDGYVTINRKAVTVKADNKSKTYGTSDPTLTATITGRVSTSDTITYSISRASGSNVGTYMITPSGNATQGNYTVTYQTGTFTINKAAASALGLSVSGGTYTYNGTARSITASTSVTSGTTIYYSSNGSSGWTTTKPTLTNVGSITTYVKAVNSNYNDATGNAKVTINKAAASALGLSVTAYSALYNGSAHKVTASVSVTSGTTIQYSTDNTNWSTTNPTRTNVGTTTVYVRAVNSNYNTATATSSVTNKCRITVNTTPSASVKFGTSATVTANSSGVATYDTSVTGSWTITATKNSVSTSGSVTVPTNSGNVSLALTVKYYLFKAGEGAKVTIYAIGPDASMSSSQMTITTDQGYFRIPSVDMTNYSKIGVRYKISTILSSGYAAQLHIGVASHAAMTLTSKTETTELYTLTSIDKSTYDISLSQSSNRMTSNFYDIYLEM